jgi:hypothetical protein
VRAALALTTAVLVACAALAPGSPGERDTGACASGFSCTGVRVPAPITIDGYGLGPVGYQIQRDGRVRRIATIPSPPRDIAFGRAPGVWWAVRDRHLVIGRGDMRWRSRGEYALSAVNLVQVGSDAAAFSYANQLYLAPLWGSERPIASGDSPLGFTTGGLYTNQRGHRLLLRSDTGHILKTIARAPLPDDYFAVNGSLYFIAHDRLMRARGARVQRLVSLRHLRLSARSLWMQPIGALLELEDAHRLVLLRADGSLFASTPLRGSQYRQENAVNLAAIAPGVSAVAFVFPGQGETPGPETVYVLRAGERTAIAVHREQVAFGCDRWVGVQWHRTWLLYADADSHLTLIDTADVHRTIDLSGLARRLPGGQGSFSAHWSGQPPGL